MRLDKMSRRKDQNQDSGMNKKQKQTKDSLYKEDEFEAKELESNVRSYITHNKGGKWELIKAPQIDSEGKQVNCYTEEGCSLNLQIYSNNGMFAPPYSQESSVGLIMAVGNVGEELIKTSLERTNTYLSRDGGLSW
jgi:hypothetical protein